MLYEVITKSPADLRHYRLLALLIVLDQIPFIDQNDKTSAFLQDIAYYLGILLGNPLIGVDQHSYNVV